MVGDGHAVATDQALLLGVGHSVTFGHVQFFHKVAITRFQPGELMRPALGIREGDRSANFLLLCRCAVGRVPIKLYRNLREIAVPDGKAFFVHPGLCHPQLLCGIVDLQGLSGAVLAVEDGVFLVLRHIAHKADAAGRRPIGSCRVRLVDGHQDEVISFVRFLVARGCLGLHQLVQRVVVNHLLVAALFFGRKNKRTICTGFNVFIHGSPSAIFVLGQREFCIFQHLVLTVLFHLEQLEDVKIALAGTRTAAGRELKVHIVCLGHMARQLHAVDQRQFHVAHAVVCRDDIRVRQLIFLPIRHRSLDGIGRFSAGIHSALTRCKQLPEVGIRHIHTICIQLDGIRVHRSGHFLWYGEAVFYGQKSGLVQQVPPARVDGHGVVDAGFIVLVRFAHFVHIEVLAFYRGIHRIRIFLIPGTGCRIAVGLALFVGDVVPVIAVVYFHLEQHGDSVTILHGYGIQVVQLKGQALALPYHILLNGQIPGSGTIIPRKCGQLLCSVAFAAVDTNIVLPGVFQAAGQRIHDAERLGRVFDPQLIPECCAILFVLDRRRKFFLKVGSIFCGDQFFQLHLLFRRGLFLVLILIAAIHTGVARQQVWNGPLDILRQLAQVIHVALVIIDIDLRDIQAIFCTAPIQGDRKAADFSIIIRHFGRIACICAAVKMKLRFQACIRGVFHRPIRVEDCIVLGAFFRSVRSENHHSRFQLRFQFAFQRIVIRIRLILVCRGELECIGCGETGSIRGRACLDGNVPAHHARAVSLLPDFIPCLFFERTCHCTALRCRACGLIDHGIVLFQINIVLDIQLCRVVASCDNVRIIRKGILFLGRPFRELIGESRLTIGLDRIGIGLGLDCHITLDRCALCPHRIGQNIAQHAQVFSIRVFYRDLPVDSPELQILNTEPAGFCDDCRIIFRPHVLAWLFLAIILCLCSIAKFPVGVLGAVQAVLIGQRVGAVFRQGRQALNREALTII